jgi:hypothetical protein
VPEAYGTSHGSRETQANLLTASVTNECTFASLTPRDVHGHPLGLLDELDFNLLGDLTKSDFTLDLFGERLAGALFPTTKVMARRDVRRRRFPNRR